MPCQRQTINVLYVCYSSLCLIPPNRRSKHGRQQQVLRSPIKSAQRPTIGPRPPLCTLLFVKQLDISLVQSFEFLLDNSDARYAGYYRRGQRIRFCMIVCQLFYSCTVKGYNTALKQWCDWRELKCSNLSHDKLNAKTESQFCLYFSIQYFFGFQ